MRNTGRIATPGKVLAPAWLVVLLAVTGLGWAPARTMPAARPPAAWQAVTNQVTYNAGDDVWLKIISPSVPAGTETARYLLAVRYAGEARPLAEGLVLGRARNSSPGYHLLWKVPLDARTGRHEIDLRVQDPRSHEVIQDVHRIASFVVHRQVIQIVSAEVTQPYYTAGDNIACSVKIENLTASTITGLRLEFSERYWPWIVQQRERVGKNIRMLASDITLKPHSRASYSFPQCAVAAEEHQSAIRQYAAVIWDRDRKNVQAIAFTPLVFINPPGIKGPQPYPLQYTYPSLDAVNTSSYRHFHREPYGAGAIQFDTHHTQFPTGDEARLRFTLANPTGTAWRRVTVRARLLGPDGKQWANQVVAPGVDLNEHGPKLTQEVIFRLPAGVSGLFHASVEITGKSGRELASNVLELGVNPLPGSVLLFCAHEDDDGTQMGFIRSLVENQVPFHMVYFTSGDAGSCDRYFQRSCGPAEALNFGALRMAEARAAMGHLGVPAADILFLGLPDGGMGKIWYGHPFSSAPYPAVLLASDHAPYEGLFRPNLAYARDAVLEATEAIIKKFQPGVVFATHPPAEGHIDHIVNNYFVVKALQTLLREGAISPSVELRVDRVFDPQAHPATPYRYENHPFYVSGDAMALTQEAGWFYQSQGGNREEGNLRTWDQLRRTEDYRKMLDWKNHEGWNEKE